jgi:hypothetical protein
MVLHDVSRLGKAMSVKPLTPAEAKAEFEKALEQIARHENISTWRIEKLRSAAETWARASELDGIEEGVRKYAWWKDGEQHVGTCGTTLKSALAKLREEPKP